MNSKEENSKDFCPMYVQEFGLCLLESLSGSVEECTFKKENFEVISAKIVERFPKHLFSRPIQLRIFFFCKD
jgi:hypothetical protein